MDIYKYLRLDKLDCCVAIIKNAKSNKMGKKDIIKIECPLEMIDLDILGFIDHNITVNIIENEKIVDKMSLKLPKKNHQCDPLQKPEMHHFHRAGAGSCVYSDGSGT